MFFPTKLLQMLSLFGLQLSLIYINHLNAAAANHKLVKPPSLEEYLSEFENVANTINNLFGERATAGDEGAFGEGAPKDCKFVCNNGGTPTKKVGYIPKENGCGAYGIKVDLSALPGMERCCSKHDRCYGQCGTERLSCDEQFAKCLSGVCNQLEGAMDLNTEESEGCMMAVQMMFMTVMELGCQTYLETQNEACVCKIDNSTNFKSKKKVKIEL